MGVPNKFWREINSLIGQFEIFQKGDKLFLGVLDDKIRKLIVKILDESILVYEDDLKFFQIMESIGEFIEKMHLANDGSDWMIWSEVDFSKLNELSLGSKDELWKLEEVRDFYS